MTVDDVVLGLSPLTYWKITDRSGTTAPDSGSLNLPLTLTAPADGASLTTGGGLSLRGDGTNGRGTTGGLAADHPLRFKNNAPFTWAGWFGARTLSGTRTIFGRSGSYSLRWRSGGDAAVYGPGGTWGADQQAINGQQFLAMTWDGRECLFYVNGLLAVGTPAAATNSDTGDAFEVLALSNGNGAIGDIERVFICGRAIGGGDLRDVYEAGALTPFAVTGAGALANFQDTRTVVSASGAAGGCYSCGGDMRANEAVIVVGVNRWHVSCYGGRIRSVAVTVPDPGWTAQQLGGAVARTVFDNILLRATAKTGPGFFDGSVWALPSNTGHAEIAGAACGAAALHWMSGSQKPSWLSRVAQATSQQYIDTQQANNPPGSGNFAGAYGPFAPGPVMALGMGYVLETYFLLQDVLTSQKKAEWRVSFGLAGDYWVRTEKNYYVNGNIECAELYNLWMIFKATGNTYWQEQYEAQLVKVANPAGMGNTGGDNAAGVGSTGFGWIQTVTGSQADGSDSKGYFAESRNSPGNHPGWDAVYTYVQIGHLGRLFLRNRDSRVLFYINAMVNYMEDRANTGTSGTKTSAQGNLLQPDQTDHTGSARHSDGVLGNATNWVWWWLTRNPQYRTVNPLSYNQAATWGRIETDYRNNRGALGIFMRNFGEELFPLLQVSPTWPASRNPFPDVILG